MPQLMRYQVIEVTDLKTMRKSYKIYERPSGTKPPLYIGIPTREQAEDKLRELEGQPPLMGRASS